MRKAISVSALILALTFTFSTHAGDMQNGVNNAPQPTPTPAIQELTSDGEVDSVTTAPTADGTISNEVAITFVQVMLNLLALS